MAQWIGYMVSVKCTGDLGTFQGEIASATNSTVTLRKVFCNGFPCQQNEVKIRADTIADLKLIDKQSGNSEEHSTVTIAKPIAKRAGRTQSITEPLPSPSSNSIQTKANTTIPQISKPRDIEAPSTHLPPPLSQYQFNKINQAQNKRGGGGGVQRGLKTRKDEECFGSPSSGYDVGIDFDFEKNLKLFDKRAIWDELNAQRPDLVKHTEKRFSKYRHDENVIATLPTTFRQIHLSKQHRLVDEPIGEYVTDDGLVIPSVSRASRERLWACAERKGLTWQRRAELTGRAAAELGIRLLGGGHRLNPRNEHQRPSVVILCGPHRQGAVGVNAARQLASHGVKTHVYAHSLNSTTAAPLKEELALYRLTNEQIVLDNDIADLPTIGYDLLILALFDADSEDPAKWQPTRALCNWLRGNRAPALALDPPPEGISPAIIEPKYSLVPVLPLQHAKNNGKLYLCNLGFPVEVFKEVGIKYKSPFGPKFVIALHPKED